MKETQSQIRIYVACLAAYNSGILHGRWIDADQCEDKIHQAIRDMLNASPIPDAEEHAIHDHEGFEGLRISEYEGIAEITKIAGFIAEHGKLGAELIDYFGDLGSAQDALDDNYSGVYRSLSEFAEELTGETTQIPDSLRYYIDYEAMARDMEINDVLTIETGFEEVHVFWRH